MEVLAEVHHSFSTIQDTSIVDHDYIPQNIIEILPTKTREEVSTIKSDHKDSEVFIPPTAGGVTKSAAAMVYKPRYRMKGKQTVTVTQTVKQSPGAPVPPDQQLADMFYCDKCEKCFKDKNYYHHHMTRLCKYLTNPQLLKCKYCSKLFGHENRYKDHLSVHDGIKRYKCHQCGSVFSMETQLARHKKLYCTQKKK